MTRKRPPKGDPMPFLTASDWSVGLNSPTSLGQAQLLTLLGSQLRERYEAVVREPLPERIGALLEQLEHADSRGSR